MTTRVVQEPLVQIRQAVKTYGPTRALAGVTLDVGAGEILGIVGHNGAGKSTLMRVLTGLETCDSGSVRIGGVAGPTRTGFAGVRMAYQEGSLAPELTVKENIRLSSGAAARGAVARLADIFPGHGIGAADHVDDLPIAGRQMVEIARATLADDLRLLILDEPTESLGGEAIDRLYDFVRKLRGSGCAIILVSHRLREILSVCDRVAVMKDGAIVAIDRAAGLSERDLFLAMGGDIDLHAPADAATATERTGEGPAAVRIAMTTVSGDPCHIIARRGEVIGLAGISGQGQQEVLERLWRATRGDADGGAQRAYVPGDRQRSGILPLWNVAANLSISALAALSRRGIRRTDKESALVADWVDRLKIRGGAKAAITGLSGGNQQKVIVARAFASRAEVILLDDPFRGVDVHTKAELYRLIRAEAARGRTIVWYSSENSEMQHCDRAYVLRAGRVAGELRGADISDERIIAMSFSERQATAA